MTSPSYSGSMGDSSSKVRDFTGISSNSFEEEALRQFHYQYHHVSVYHDFVDLLKISPKKVHEVSSIPFLPVELFKTHKVLSAHVQAHVIFRSSGTTGLATSEHHVADSERYRLSFRRSFGLYYGSVSDYCVLALLPSYLERNDSSLVFMAQDMIQESGHKSSGFYLDDLARLSSLLIELNAQRQKTLLLGVTFALLDLAAFYVGPKLENTVVMETGGMKGRRREMVRTEVHEILKSAFGVAAIHSEYGMTELLSQAWSGGEGAFRAPPWMRVLLRESNDPLSLENSGRAGGLNIIDLANLYSCSFLATQDLGKLSSDGTFQVLGRFDASDIRGCNLLVETG